jgi:hypothetical protein
MQKEEVRVVCLAGEQLSGEYKLRDKVEMASDTRMKEIPSVFKHFSINPMFPILT